MEYIFNRWIVFYMEVEVVTSTNLIQVGWNSQKVKVIMKLDVNILNKCIQPWSFKPKMAKTLKVGLLVFIICSNGI